MLDESVILALNTVRWKQNTRGPDWQNEYVSKHAGREKPLYKDPFMYLFKPTGDDPLPKKMQLPLSIRHRFFSRAISQEVKNNNIKQVIILGSGLDTRPIRKKKYSEQYGVHFFECDRKSVIDYKKRIFKENNIKPNSKMISLDYIEGDIIAELKKQGCDFEKPSFILLEGNSMYITKDKLTALFLKIKESFPKVVIAFDYIHADFIEKKQKETTAEQAKQNFTKNKTKWVNGYSNAEEIALEIGLTVQSDRIVADLEKEYKVEEDPYPTAFKYSVCTLRS